MSGWIAPLVAAMVARRQREEQPISTEKSPRVRVLYVKRVNVPASSYYANDFTVMDNGFGQFEITPTRIEVPATREVHMVVEEYLSLDDAKPFVIRDGMVLRASSFQERTLDGEWDGMWQEINRFWPRYA